MNGTAEPPPAFDADFRAGLLQLFQWRRDVRSFDPRPIPRELRDRLLGIAALAPSVGLSQPWRFVIVDDPARREKIRANFQRCNQEALSSQPDSRKNLYARLKLAGLGEAPWQIALCVEPDPAQGAGLGRATMPETVAYSAVMAIHTLWLAARAEGIGLGWVSILDPGEVKAALDLPAHWRLIGYFCLGYPKDEHGIPELEREGWELRRPAASQCLQR